MSTTDTRFAFGANWQEFVHGGVNDTRTGAAVTALRRQLGVDRLDGLSVLDVGCGSGLSSLAAYRLGAHRVVGFDYDPLSVAASTAVRDRTGVPAERWTIVHGSILDAHFLQTLPPPPTSSTRGASCITPVPCGRRSTTVCVS